MTTGGPGPVGSTMDYSMDIDNDDSPFEQYGEHEDVPVCPCDAEMLGQPVPQSISNVEAQKCPICLDIFKTQEIGIPDTCKHIFCCSCLQQWSKTRNTCPVDRKRFSAIRVRCCLQGMDYGMILVRPPTRQQDDEVEGAETFCELCDGNDRREQIIRCDACFRGYHVECLHATNLEPWDEWLCPECIHF